MPKTPSSQFPPGSLLGPELLRVWPAPGSNPGPETPVSFPSLETGLLAACVGFPLDFALLAFSSGDFPLQSTSYFLLLYKYYILTTSCKSDIYFRGEGTKDYRS